MIQFDLFWAPGFLLRCGHEMFRACWTFSVLVRLVVGVYFFNTPRTLWEKGIWIDFRSGYCVVSGTSLYTVSFSLPFDIFFCLFAGFPLLFCDLLQLYPSYPLPLLKPYLDCLTLPVPYDVSYALTFSMGGFRGA